MKPVGVYRWYDKYTAPDTSDVTREGPEVRRGQLVEISQLSTVDYSTADKALLVGFKDENRDVHYFRKEDGTTKWECHLSGRILLLPGEKPIGTVLSPTANDVLYFSAHGLVYEYPEVG